MVNVDAKIEAIVQDYIMQGEYFTINRARQYGKTTTLDLLRRRLADEYVVIDLSFEGKEEDFSSLETFAEGFREDLADKLKPQDEKLFALWGEPLGGSTAIRYLSRKISEMCEISKRPVVLMIDEVDKASDYGMFSAFLGMLRQKYLERSGKGTPTFQSVILAGVHDIKNLRAKIRPDAEHSYNSPWNIAAPFDVDMSFEPEEIATMLAEYEGDHQTGMDIAAVSARIHYYTSGYPFLVSRLCKMLDELPLTWTASGVDEAETMILGENNMLFDDMVKNIETNPIFSKLLETVVLGDVPVSFDAYNPDIAQGVMFGVLRRDENGKVRVSNVIFETVIANYLISVSETREIAEKYATGSQFVHGGRLDVGAVIKRFAAFMKSEYRDEDGAFIERQARLLFLSFLKPIINGTGHYAVEPETRGSRRMDVVVFFGSEEHFIELKIWRGGQAAAEGYDQLAAYLKSRGRTRGYLVSFADNRKSPREGRTFRHGGCEITEAVIAYRDKE
jgi:hypothetical protein